MSSGAVPLSSSVKIETALDPSLGVLLDANKATYRINSGSEWHLLFVKAKRDAEGGVWVYSMESLKAEDAGKIYQDNGHASYDPPRFVDMAGLTIAKSTSNEAKFTPGLPYKDHPTPPPDPLELVAVIPNGGVGQALGFTEVTLKYYNREVLTRLIEVGTHIYPIAYHRIVDGNPPSMQLVQIARSDWHFWPFPDVPIWSKHTQLLSLEAGSTYFLTPPP